MGCRMASTSVYLEVPHASDRWLVVVRPFRGSFARIDGLEDGDMHGWLDDGCEVRGWMDGSMDGR